MLRFLIDHNVPKSVGVFLAGEGHDVMFVKDIDPELVDEKVLESAKEESIS